MNPTQIPSSENESPQPTSNSPIEKRSEIVSARIGRLAKRRARRLRWHPTSTKATLRLWWMKERFDRGKAPRDGFQVLRFAHAHPVVLLPTESEKRKDLWEKRSPELSRSQQETARSMRETAEAIKNLSRPPKPQSPSESGA